MKTRVTSKPTVIGREAMKKMLADEKIQKEKVAESKKAFDEKPVIGDLKPSGLRRSR